MLALLQRVSFAKVEVENQTIASIKGGLLLFCGFQPHDTESTVEQLLNKCLNYRIFPDEKGKMNLSLKAKDKALLIVPQFTLAADTNTGLRPSFSSAASPSQGKALFKSLCRISSQLYPHTLFGKFGANMQVSLCNDGPVTFMLNN